MMRSRRIAGVIASLSLAMMVECRANAAVK
jgi:hypothetical protein